MYFKHELITQQKELTYET